MSQILLEANELILVKKILSVRTHYDFVDVQGKKLGEADGNLVQNPPEFTIFDSKDVEIMRLQREQLPKNKDYTFYSYSGEKIGTIKQISGTDAAQFLVEKEGRQLMKIYPENSSKSTLESLVSLPTPEELFRPLLKYIMEADGQIVATVQMKWRPTIRNQVELSIIGNVDHRIVIGGLIVIEQVAVEGE